MSSISYLSILIQLVGQIFISINVKKQGKVKTISVKEVTEGMQVYRNQIVYKITNQADSNFVGTTLSLDFAKRNISELKTLVVEYEVDHKEANVFPSHRHLPLKYKQWQSAIDSGEVDNDKEVEFEIISNGVVFDKNWQGYAKIIPQKKRMYSEEEVERLLLRICRLCDDNLTTPKDISVWLKNNGKGELPVT